MYFDSHSLYTCSGETLALAEKSGLPRLFAVFAWAGSYIYHAG